MTATAGYVGQPERGPAGPDALAALPIEKLLRNIDDVPADKKQAVINHGGGHHNHSLFWQTLKTGVAGPSGDLEKALVADLGQCGPRSRRRLRRRRRRTWQQAGHGWWWTVAASWRCRAR